MLRQSLCWFEKKPQSAGLAADCTNRQAERKPAKRRGTFHPQTSAAGADYRTQAAISPNRVSLSTAAIVPCAKNGKAGKTNCNSFVFPPVRSASKSVFADYCSPDRPISQKLSLWTSSFALVCVNDAPTTQFHRTGERVRRTQRQSLRIIRGCGDQ